MVKVAYCLCPVRHIQYICSSKFPDLKELERLANEGYQVVELERQGSLDYCPKIEVKA